MGIIKVTNIRVYAYHGCLKEESVIGSDYSVDVTVEAEDGGLAPVVLTRLNERLEEALEEDLLYQM